MTASATPDPHASEEFFRQVTDVAPSILYVYDLVERRSVWTNQGLTAVLGYGMDAILAMGDAVLPTLIHPDDWPAYAAHAERLAVLADGEVAVLGYRMRRVDGSWCRLESRDMPFTRTPDGAVRSIVGAATDVTAAHDAAERLAARERFLRRITEVTPASLYVFDLDAGRNVWANHSLVDTLGYDRAALDTMGSSLMATIMHPDDLPRFAAHAERLRALGEGEVVVFTYRMRRADGTWRWFESREIAFERHVDGRVRAIVGAATDVTASRHATAERERLLAAEQVARTRAEALQRLTAALAPSLTATEVAQRFVDAVWEATGATQVWVGRLSEDRGWFERLATRGYSPEQLVLWDRFPATGGLPAVDALARQETLTFASRRELEARYPALAGAVEGAMQGSAVVPLRAGTHDLGFVAFGWREAREFTPDDVRQLDGLVAQCAQALARATLAEDVADTLALLDGVLADAPVGLAFFDRELRYVRINAELAAWNGLSVEGHLGRRFDQVRPTNAARVVPILERVLREGEAVRGLVVTADHSAAPSAVGRTFRTSFFPVRRAGRREGDVIAVGVVVEDITALAREAEDREFLLRLGAELQRPEAGAPPEAAVLAGLAELRRHLDVDRVAFTTIAADEGSALAHELRRDGELRPVRALPLAPFASLNPGSRAGQSLVLEDTAAAGLPAPAVAAFADEGVGALVHVPMLRAGRWIASISVAHERPRRWTAREVALVESVAARLLPAYETAIAFAAEREANAAKGTFLANMSHELRTPLNAIQGHVHLLLHGIHGALTDAQRESLERITRAQKHLLGLINDVLNYARIEAGRVEYVLGDVDLAQAAEAALQMVETQAAAKGLATVLEVEPGAAHATVRADGEKLAQVLLNLLANAVKFTPGEHERPGGRITVRVHATPDAHGRRALSVHDTGIGIPAARLETIFEPFVQVRSDLARPNEGTGLGLAISRDLVRGMGGELRVTSEEGAGATFTVLLPATTESRAGPAA